MGTADWLRTARARPPCARPTRCTRERRSRRARSSGGTQHLGAHALADVAHLPPRERVGRRIVLAREEDAVEHVEQPDVALQRPSRASDTAPVSLSLGAACRNGRESIPSPPARRVDATEARRLDAQTSCRPSAAAGRRLNPQGQQADATRAPAGVRPEAERHKEVGRRDGAARASVARRASRGLKSTASERAAMERRRAWRRGGRRWRRCGRALVPSHHGLRPPRTPPPARPRPPPG